jgi:hypothetical protein
VKNHRSRLLIGRTIFLTVKIDVCGLWLAETHFRMKIYNLAFQWVCLSMYIINHIIIHLTHYIASDWLRTYSQFIGLLSATKRADNKFILCIPVVVCIEKSSSRQFTEWKLLVFSVEKMYNKTIIEFGFHMISISCSTSSNNCLLFEV